MTDTIVRNIAYPGPPTHGSFSQGDRAIDTNADLWYCTKGGSAALGTATFVSAQNFLDGTTGIGNGSSANLSALAQGTGTGPASDVVNAWVPVTVNGVAGWIPFFV